MQDDSAIGHEAGKRAVEQLQAALEKRKAGLDKAAQRVAQAMNAKMVKTANYEGKITDEKSYVDHRTRLDAARIVIDVYGAKEPEEHKHELTGDFSIALVVDALRELEGEKSE